MSHSQFHSMNLFILRHAWLNLWDKHMTTGRINQVTITLGSPHAHTHTLRVCHSYVYIYMRASFPSLRKEPHNRMHASLFPTFVFVSSSWKHFVFVSEMRPRIVPNSRGAPVGQASFWAVLLLSFSAGLCVALAQVSAQSRFASSPPFGLREYRCDLASLAYLKTTHNKSYVVGAPNMGHQPQLDCVGADLRMFLCFP